MAGSFRFPCWSRVERTLQTRYRLCADPNMSPPVILRQWVRP
jgi:hypothetical protein